MGQKHRRRRTQGIKLQSHKSRSTEQPLAPAPLPRELVLPLEGGLSARDVRPAIETGQRVMPGVRFRCDKRVT